MSSLPRCGYSSIQSQGHIQHPYKSKNLNLKHRHYSSNKFIKTLMLNQTKSNQIQRQGGTEATDGYLQKKELKRYCINKFRGGTSGQQQKLILKRKNSSLKLFKKDDSKNYCFQRNSELKNLDSGSRKDDKFNKSFSRDTLSSQQTISVKRRVEILKLGRNHKHKLQIKDQNFNKDANKGDVSFQEKLKNPHFQQEKILSTQKIRSQNVLGNGLKKCSSSKMKILVKNPFERHIKHIEQPQPVASANKISIQEIPQLKQSQIVQLDQSNPSMQYRTDIQQLLSMM